jgi:hypothetical protein
MTSPPEPGGATTPRTGRTANPAMLETMGLAYIHAWLTGDYWTIAQITLAMEQAGATWQQVAESFSLAAASLLTDVYGGHSALAAAAAATKAHEDAARQARAALRSAGLPRLHFHPGVDIVSWRGDRFCRRFRGRCPVSLGLTLHVVLIPCLPLGMLSLDHIGPRGQLI